MRADVFVSSIGPGSLDRAVHCAVRSSATLTGSHVISAADQPVVATLKERLGSSARAIDDHLNRVLECDDPTGPHKMRVALRRLRATLVAFRPVLRKKVRTRLARAARTLGGVLAPLRDADVLIEGFVRPAGVDEAMLAILLDWRHGIRQHVREHWASERAWRLPVDLIGVAETGLWRRAGSKAQSWLAAPSATLLAFALAQAWAALEERGERLLELDAATRHKLRRDVRTVRYIAEMSPLNDYQPGLVVLRKLQARLGLLSDLAMVARLQILDNEAGKEFSALRKRILTDERSHAALRSAAAGWLALTEEVARWPRPA